MAIPEASQKRWRLWQVETAIACNLNCIMCPWHGARRQLEPSGIMSPVVWEAMRPHLNDATSIDFSGGGEPLLQPMLARWIRQAHEAGCETGFLTNGLLLSEETARKVMAAGVDWVAVSVDGATADIYQNIRKGSDYRRVCKNIKRIAAMRISGKPKLALNFVIMKSNAHQLLDIVELASGLGVDQINFKQCDVIRGEQGKEQGLFAKEETKTIRRLKKNLKKAVRRAKRLNIHTTAYPFVPDEQPVCDQDPRDSLFIRYDGYTAPCINLAYGGPTTFLGEPAFMPTIHFGKLPLESLPGMWDSPVCREYRERFHQRTQAYDAAILNCSFEPSLIKLKEVLQTAVSAMPEAPGGCSVCHYLYNV